MHKFKNNYIIVKNNTNRGRCIFCEANCGIWSEFRCECDMDQYYIINIRKLRKKKLKKIKKSIK
jgi:hypothetical protein